MSRWIAILVALVLLGPAVPAAAAVLTPPGGTDLDYQLGGDREVPGNVGTVVRDRISPPLLGRYNICYVNGFQTQPDESRFWKQRMQLVLKRRGHPVVDSAWGEWLLDIRTKRKRAQLAAIVGGWTKGCARSGYDAVEFDNLDSFTRSQGLLKRRHAVAFARLLVRRAHDEGLAAAQKNLAELDGRTMGFDFAIAEECGRYRECAQYVRYYGDHVLVVEYRRIDFEWTCSHFGDRLAVVLRDRELTPTGVREWC